MHVSTLLRKKGISVIFRQIRAQDWFQHQGKIKLSQNVIPLLRCHSQILWCTLLRDLVLQLHSLLCECFWEVVFSLHSLKLSTWALKKPSVFETSVSLLNQVETSQRTQKTLKMDIQLNQDTHINQIIKSFLRKSNREKKMTWRTLCGLKSPLPSSPRLQKNLVELLSSSLLPSLGGGKRFVFEWKETIFLCLRRTSEEKNLICYKSSPANYKSVICSSMVKQLIEAHPSKYSDKNPPSCRPSFFLVLIILPMSLSFLALLTTSIKSINLV